MSIPQALSVPHHVVGHKSGDEIVRVAVPTLHPNHGVDPSAIARLIAPKQISASAGRSGGTTVRLISTGT